MKAVLDTSLLIASDVPACWTVGYGLVALAVAGS